MKKTKTSPAKSEGKGSSKQASRSEQDPAANLQNDPDAQRHALTKAFLKEEASGVKNAIAKGRIIQRGEELLKPLGKFGEWIDNDLSITHQHALKLKRCVEAEDEHGLNKLLNFRASALMDLMAKSVPRSVMEKAIELAAAGETITCAKATEIINDEKANAANQAGKLRRKSKAEKVEVQRTVESAARFLQANFSTEEWAAIVDKAHDMSKACQARERGSNRPNFLSAIKWIKPARAINEYQGTLCDHYLVKDGWIYARDGGFLQAGTPFPCDGKFGVAGSVFERLGNDATDISLEDETLIVTNRAGWRSKIEIIDINDFRIDTNLEGNAHRVSSRMTGALRSLSALAAYSSGLPSTMGILVYQQCAYVYPKWAVVWVDDIGRHSDTGLRRDGACRSLPCEGVRSSFPLGSCRRLRP